MNAYPPGMEPSELEQVRRHLAMAQDHNRGLIGELTEQLRGAEKRADEAERRALLAEKQLVEMKTARCGNSYPYWGL